MSWSTVNFGKHKGKTLPQIIFIDPDWFFWAVEEDIFKNKGSLNLEAQELYEKACNIRIKNKKGEKMLAEYIIHPSTNKFSHFNIVPESQPEHEGSSPTFLEEVIDLSIPREIAPYDKLGCRHMLTSLKFHVFGNSNTRMTKKRCEEFFEDPKNFV